MAKKIKFQLSLYLKFICLILALVLFISGILSTYFILSARKMMMSDLKNKGITLARNMAHNSKFGILVSSREELKKVVAAAAEDQDVVYSFITDEEGGI